MVTSGTDGLFNRGGLKTAINTYVVPNDGVYKFNANIIQENLRNGFARVFFTVDDVTSGAAVTNGAGDRAGPVACGVGADVAVPSTAAPGTKKEP